MQEDDEVKHIPSTGSAENNEEDMEDEEEEMLQDEQAAKELAKKLKKSKKKGPVSENSFMGSPAQGKKADKVTEPPNPGNRFGDQRGKHSEVRGQVKYGALRELLRSELKAGRIMDRSKASFDQFKLAHPEAFPDEVDAKVYSSVVTNMRSQWEKLADEYVSPDYVHKANNRERKPQNHLHQSKTLRELAALLLEWMDEDGTCSKKASYDLCRLLTIANKYGDQTAVAALDRTLEIYKEARVGNWMGEFVIRGDGHVWPGARYKAITVSWAAKYNMLLQTCTDNPKAVLPSENLANQIVRMTNDLDCDDIVAAEPNPKLVQVLRALIEKEYFKLTENWHEKLCVLFLHHGAGLPQMVKVFENCDCNPKGHNGEAKNKVCIKYPCANDVHHYCCFGVTHALMAFGIMIPAINIMLTYPSVFLTTNVVAALAWHKSHCLWMMRFFEVLNLQDQLDIGEHMIACQAELEDRRELWKVLGKMRMKFQGEPPGVIVEFIRAEAWQRQKDFIKAIEAGNFHLASQKRAKEVKYGCKFTEQELQNMQIEAKKAAGEKMCLDTYNAVLTILQALAEKDKSGLQAYPVQALCAAVVLEDLKAGKRVSFLQLDPGCGKTFILCLILKCLQKLDDFKGKFPRVIVVVPTDWLKVVLLKVAEKFELDPMPDAIFPDEIESRPLQGTLWIVDEFPAMINDAECMWAPGTCRLRGKLKLGLTDEHCLIMMGGFAKERFMKFFADAYPGAGKHIMGRSADFTHDGAPEKTTFTVRCCRTKEDRLLELYARANKVFENSPRNVIIFGHKHDPKGPYDFISSKVLYIDSVDAAEKFVRSCTNMRRYVICIEPEYALGLDMKFTVDAKCFVVWPDNVVEDAEYMKQMLSRGARGGSLELGTVFLIGNPEESQYVEDRLRLDEGLQFYEGGKILRTMANIAKKVNNDPALLKQLSERMGPEWKTSRAQYANQVGDGYRPIFLKYFDD